MALLVVGYPTFSAADYRWIQAFRADHDPQFRSVAPHVTLVFPFDEMPEEELVAHVRRQTQATPKLAVTLACALPMPDPGTGGAHLFLVPDAGFAALVKLHDRLYSGPLAPYLRTDLPFVPHLTIGWKAQPAEAHRLAGELNAQDFVVEGMIPRLTVVRRANGSVTNLVELPLLGTGG
jgi:2'-5' RNA ligase